MLHFGFFLHLIHLTLSSEPVSASILSMPLAADLASGPLCGGCQYSLTAWSPSSSSLVDFHVLVYGRSLPISLISIQQRHPLPPLKYDYEFGGSGCHELLQYVRASRDSIPFQP